MKFQVSIFHLSTILLRTRAFNFCWGRNLCKAGWIFSLITLTPPAIYANFTRLRYNRNLSFQSLRILLFFDLGPTPGRFSMHDDSNRRKCTNFGWIVVFLIGQNLHRAILKFINRFLYYQTMTKIFWVKKCTLLLLSLLSLNSEGVYVEYLWFS